MKLTFKFFFAICAIVLLFGTSLARQVKKTKTHKLKLKLPQDYSKDDTTITDLAKKQNASAAKLLSTPGKKAKAILAEAANGIKAFLDNTSDKALIWKDAAKFDPAWDFNRSLYGGILETKDATKFTQATVLVKVKSGTASGVENAGALAICGDVGTAVFDFNGRKADVEKKKLDDPKDKTKNPFEAILPHISTAVSISSPSLIALGGKIKAQRGGTAIAPNKKKRGNKPAERGEVKDKKGDKKMDERSGVMNLKNGDFKAKWPWQTIPEKYLKKCKEPWAGHYSGSIVEVLFGLDIFTKTNSDFGHDPALSFDFFRTDKANADIIKDMKNELDSPYRKCKGALAAAFLIAIGYHSAIEVKPTVWLYLGLPKPPIFNNASPTTECDTKATSDMVKLMDDCNAEKDPL